MSDETTKSSSDNVQVAVRCRPLSSTEEKAGHSVVVSVDGEQGEVVLTPPTFSTGSRRGEQPRTFVFDSVFGPESQQLDIYNETARPIVDSVLEGYNGEPQMSSSPLDRFLRCVARYNICLWPDRHGEDIHHAGREGASREKRNHPQLLCSHLWSHCLLPRRDTVSHTPILHTSILPFSIPPYCHSQVPGTSVISGAVQ